MSTSTYLCTCITTCTYLCTCMSTSTYLCTCITTCTYLCTCITTSTYIRQTDRWNMRVLQENTLSNLFLGKLLANFDTMKVPFGALANV